MIARLGAKRLPALIGVGLGVGSALYSQGYFSNRAIHAESVGALKPDQWVDLPIKSLKAISHDTNHVVLDLPADHTLGGETAFCVLFKFVKDGKPVIRPYTPTSDPSLTGEADFVIKKYPNGLMGNHIAGLSSGDSISVKGPISKFPLKANQFKDIALIGGGSGITPLFQVLQKVAKDPKDDTKVTLYYGSKTKADVLLKKEIDELVAKKPKTLKVVYFVDKNADGDKDLTEGYISKEYLSKNLFKPSSSGHVFVCGPPPLYEAISGNKKSPSDQGELTGALKELGFTSEQVFKF